ncbi:DUF4153 domain-containing protein [Sphingopyxis sp. XHP0097]|uniref:DUF4153 domain-containing protein n=2 Tax=Sphingopyxis jiangsuensis TaxID=2871171 RepID=A0ABS7MCC3_9SPHN|nr:DUF4153 domain-containing protein [Sphingopyxis jiangsuensis]
MSRMTDAATPPAADSPRAASARLDDSDAPWPLRPWIMAALCAVAGLLFHLLIDHQYPERLAAWRSALAAAVAVATIVFVLGVEQRRWHWALGFAALWGVIMGLIAWQTAGYNLQGTPVEWPFWSGMLAVLVATPLFQTRRDVAPDWRFWKLWQMPYARLHSHAWADAVLGAASLAFVGVTFLLTVLIGQMFKLIGINLIFDLLNDEWFGWMLAGAAFGGAVGVLRERDRLVATLQRLVMIVLAVLAPVLAAALLLFLLSLVGTGLGGLWSSGFSTAALMLAAAAFAVLLANAVIGNGGDEGSANRMMRGAAALLALAVLPLAAIAAASMQVRIGQYGWTPERIWGAIAVGIALAYGIAGLWAVALARWRFDELLRPLQQRLAIALMLLALSLALPLFDFGAISTRDQLARLESGAVKAEQFDWAAMAFDFGPEGRAALAALAKSSDKARADAAQAALGATNRYDLDGPRGLVPVAPIEERLRILPEGRALPDGARERIADSYMCSRSAQCVAVVIDEGRIAVLGQSDPGGAIQSDFVTRNDSGRWVVGQADRQPEAARKDVDLSTATISVETVAQRRVMVDGVAETEGF